ncbi:WD40-repeat-containing domain protein [Nemania abortiva]|nr:WD40-repeat-containing domain protein [Nemania abortiva]
MAEAFGVAASALAVAELSAKVISLCLQYSREVKHARDDIERTIKNVTNFQTVAKELEDLLNGPHREQLQASQKLRDALEGSQVQLGSLHDKLIPSKTRQKMSKLGVRALKWPFESKEIEKVLQELVRCMEPVTIALQIDEAATVLKIDKNIVSIDQKTVLDKFPIADGASFDSHADEHSPTCLPGTRLDLIRKIEEWVDDPAAKAVFWLNGMAGTGKSTISRTLASNSFERGQLGASFFFKRGEGDRGKASKFFTTIASQLVQREPALAPHVKEAIDANPSIFGKALAEQCKKLISEPLSKISSPDRSGDVLVIVIDALDECDGKEDIRRIIHLLSLVNVSQSPRLRVLLTSRPELPIRLGFKDVQGTYQDFVLHQIEQPIIEHDISTYFKHELVRIRDDDNKDRPEDRKLQPTWPDSSDIMILVKIATPLFIVAATACRFIADHRIGPPEANLRIILAQQAISQDDKFDATYLPVLEQLIAGLREGSKDKVLTLFKRLVGSIILLASPLSASALEKLLNISLAEIDNHLRTLHSVLSIPSSSSASVRLLHLSFRDFLLDPSKRDRNPFWVDEKETHKQLVTDCLHVMSKVLRKDICEVKWPGTPHTSISPSIVNSKLHPEVQYACRHWVYHLQRAKNYITDDDQVHWFLKKHFLHWLEALSHTGRASESLQSISVLQSRLQSEDSVQVSRFINDALRFARTNILTIQATPLQVYSTLVFTPEKSIIRDTFQNDIPDWISLRPSVDKYWSNCLQTLDGHTDSISSVTFSPDGTVIASASADNTIQLWSPTTGECLLQALEGHTNSVRSVAFSPDGGVIASGSNDKTIRLWSTTTGECLQTLNGHNNFVFSVTFSPDGAIIASQSEDAVRLCSSITGECLQTLEGHTDLVTSVAFSPDGTVIASGFKDRTIRLWSTTTGEYLQALEGHTDWVTSVAFSPDGGVMASGSNDKTIRLWSTTTGEYLQTLEGHTDWVTSVAFSPDGGVIASGSNDKTIRLWSTTTSECLQTLKGHTYSIQTVSFSPDSKIVASGSVDRTIRLWSSTIGERLQTLENHSAEVSAVAISPNKTVIASGSADKTIRLWSWSAGESTCLQTLEGHTSLVVIVTFSPDGALIASGSSDNTIRLWSWSAGESKCLQIFKGHTDWVGTVAFSPDGAFIASGSYDKTIRLWSASESKCLQIIRGHFGWVVTVAFSPDGALIASGSDDKTIRLWSWSANRSHCIRIINFNTTSQPCLAGTFGSM